MRSHFASLPIIDVAIVTVARPQDYIHDLISRLRPDIALRLVVGSPDCEYLRRYRENPFIEIIQPPSSEWAHFQNCVVHQRAAWNYWRTLNLDTRNLYRQGMIVFEDDIIPARKWEGRLFEIIDQIESHHITKYILALYDSLVGLPKPLNNVYYTQYPVQLFYGTQAIYYPEAIRIDFLNYLKVNGVDNFRIPYDHLLKEFAEEIKVPIFAASPCLVQHIGEISTGLGTFHKTDHFDLEM